MVGKDRKPVLIDLKKTRAHEPPVKSAPGKAKPAPAAASKARQPAKPTKPVEKKHDSKPAKKR